MACEESKSMQDQEIDRQHSVTNVSERLEIRITPSGLTVELYDVTDDRQVLHDDVWKTPFKVEQALDDTYNIEINETLVVDANSDDRSGFATVVVDFDGLSAYLQVDGAMTPTDDPQTRAYCSVSHAEVANSVYADADVIEKRTLEQ
jgi:hypothetical protein